MGQYFIFGALYPSKSGLMNKHTVKQTNIPWFKHKHNVTDITEFSAIDKTLDLTLAGCLSVVNIVKHNAVPVQCRLKCLECLECRKVRTYEKTYRKHIEALTLQIKVLKQSATL